MKNIYYSITVFILLAATSCEDWLTETPPASTSRSEYFTTGLAAVYATNAAYVPLQWEYNYTYFSEWFIGDVVSDDALKGGQNIGDMSDVYALENFKTTDNNGLLLDFYRAQYQGISRCNLALEEIPKMKNDSVLTTRLQSHLIGELKFLRALYYFRLVRVFGGVPWVDFVIESANDWQQARAGADAIYTHILNDLKDANGCLWKKSEYKEEDYGRATKGAAQSLLLKTNLYTHNYPEAKNWGDSIIDSNEYDLETNYANLFLYDNKEALVPVAGENGLESVFEIQFVDDATSDYGGSNGEGGNGYTRGTFTAILTRSRSSLLGGGWGFNKPTQNLYNEYETDDPRRDVTILNPDDSQMEKPDIEIYLGNRYLNRKTGMYTTNGDFVKLSHQSRGALNNKLIRYADVLLMYAEACCETDHLNEAKEALNKVRQRARGEDTSILPDFPYGAYADNKADLVKAVRHERRVELAMEGHRWFDLCRWGIAKATIDAYKDSESEEVQQQMAEFIAGKHELFPIPSQERDLNPMEQNQGY
ncbi:MAG: RagB/SusD family nutrient uptake outer membrane protein [Candidatus Ordinivivax streblomastigis]|uniref:RagB/SusD family nutrient uptake outer membrane protein n=1 Tax=Candidatus Ordinivivax streblomastigis TaxID=2540710 RepID=A0A5M8P1H0_9BACT|nr:MAG: RagB/SusD family nutrient uptake outer membrane protein [Candidatus Ordinivivax streblomastigis]